MKVRRCPMSEGGFFESSGTSYRKIQSKTIYGDDSREINHRGGGGGGGASLKVGNPQRSEE